MGTYEELDAVVNSINGGSRKNLSELRDKLGLETLRETAAKVIREETRCAEGSELDSLRKAAKKSGQFSPMGLLSRYTSNVYRRYYP